MSSIVSAWACCSSCRLCRTQALSTCLLGWQRAVQFSTHPIQLQPALSFSLTADGIRVSDQAFEVTGPAVDAAFQKSIGLQIWSVPGAVSLLHARAQHTPSCTRLQGRLGWAAAWQLLVLPASRTRASGHVTTCSAAERRASSSSSSSTCATTAFTSGETVFESSSSCRACWLAISAPSGPVPHYPA